MYKWENLSCKHLTGGKTEQRMTPVGGNFRHGYKHEVAQVHARMWEGESRGVDYD